MPIAKQSLFLTNNDCIIETLEGFQVQGNERLSDDDYVNCSIGIVCWKQNFEMCVA
jgi:hypothetical protein